jgi:hypothetical protein
MRTLIRFKALWLSLALAGAGLALAVPAAADDEFDVSVQGGKVVVVAKSGWHINTKYPWKLVMGDKKLTKSEFTLTDTKATVAAPKGSGKLRGGVCSGAQCKMFSKDVSVR